jgi:hypothetical protein
MTEEEIENLEMDLEDCIKEAIAMGASPDERFAIEIIDKKIFYYQGSAIPEKFESDFYVYGFIPNVEDVEDEDDSTIAIMASEMISKALGSQL